MEFVVRALPNRPNTLEARYDCACGCKPRARYEKGTADAGHEHCCCGNVHFVGSEAEHKMQAYLAERKTKGEDVGLSYSVERGQLQAPWGQPVEWAFAVPNKHSKHMADDHHEHEEEHGHQESHERHH